jgi:hypothetical protein
MDDEGDISRQLRELVEQLRHENELLKAKVIELEVDCTPDNGQIVKQWYLRQPPFRTELEICNRELNVASFGCTPFR